jgi:hypothetical protein
LNTLRSGKVAKSIGLGTYKRMPTRKRRTRMKSAGNLEVGGRLCLERMGEC